MVTHVESFKAEFDILRAHDKLDNIELLKMKLNVGRMLIIKLLAISADELSKLDDEIARLRNE
jgi:hypothetical protein